MTEADAIYVVNEHFKLFASKQKLIDFTAFAQSATEITGSTDRRSLAAQFADNFVYSSVGDDGHLAQLVHLASAPGKDEFVDKVVMPQAAGAQYFVTVHVSWGQEKYIVYAFVKDGAFAGDLNKIVDPITGTFQVRSQNSVIRGSERRTLDFTNGFGQQAAHYEVYISARCNGDSPETCDGFASGTDSTPLMSARVDYKVRKTAHCCVVDYVLIGTGGVPDIKISYSNEKSKFEAEISGFGWQYLNEAGSLSDCCPVRPQLSESTTVSDDAPSTPRPIPPETRPRPVHTTTTTTTTKTTTDSAGHTTTTTTTTTDTTPATPTTPRPTASGGHVTSTQRPPRGGCKVDLRVDTIRTRDSVRTTTGWSFDFSVGDERTYVTGRFARNGHFTPDDPDTTLFSKMLPDLCNQLVSLEVGLVVTEHGGVRDEYGGVNQMLVFECKQEEQTDTVVLPPFRMSNGIVIQVFLDLKYKCT